MTIADGILGYSSAETILADESQCISSAKVCNKKNKKHLWPTKLRLFSSAIDVIKKLKNTGIADEILGYSSAKTILADDFSYIFVG